MRELCSRDKRTNIISLQPQAEISLFAASEKYRFARKGKISPLTQKTRRDFSRRVPMYYISEYLHVFAREVFQKSREVFRVDLTVAVDIKRGVSFRVGIVFVR